MQVIHAMLWFGVGLVGLVAGGEVLVHGAARLARTLGMTPLLVGLTVVAYGTSLPELAVTVHAAWTGAGEVALGNVVGSNIVNVLLVLGLSAAITPVCVSVRLIRFDVPIMIAVSLLVFALGWDGSISRLEGAVLLLGIVSYTVVVIWLGRREAEPEVIEEYGSAFPTPRKRPRIAWVVYGGMCCVGLGMLAVGSQWMVQSAVEIAQAFQVGEWVIGLTIVAIGTSLPEMATSLIAALRGQRDIAVGNIVGSNLFNLLLVLGAAGVLSAEGLPVPEQARWVDMPIMVAAAAACLPIFFTGLRIARWEGVVFVAYYLAYTAYLILRAGRYETALYYFRETMFLFVLPLTVLGLMVTTWQSLRRNPRGNSLS